MKLEIFWQQQQLKRYGTRIEAWIFYPKSSTHRRSKQPSTKSSESSENDKLSRFSSADEDAPLMPRAVVSSPLLAATMRFTCLCELFHKAPTMTEPHVGASTRRRHELVQFGANCMSSWQEPYCTHKEYLFSPSGSLSKMDKNRGAFTLSPPP